MALVLRWMVSDAPRFDKPQRRAGWGWLLRQAREWELREAMGGEDRSESTPQILEPLAFGPCLVRQIVSRRALFEEGMEMNHCAFDDFDEMMSGASILLSIRDTEDPNVRLATAELARLEQGWVTKRVCGPSNNDPSEEVLAAVEQARERIQAG